VLLVGILDNLGKGAAGVAVQCLNRMLGIPEQTGLTV
jgi:N-acetyl-gamma-glutamylphosphate reductase